jgi:hypothetical protein
MRMSLSSPMQTNAGRLTTSSATRAAQATTTGTELAVRG